MESHLLQMRGLKHSKLDALININESHLLQMRGLKRLHVIEGKAPGVSHLLQMRGLKPKNEFGYETLRSRIFYRCVD